MNNFKVTQPFLIELVGAGADLNALDVSNRTVLHLCAEEAMKNARIMRQFYDWNRNGRQCTSIWSIWKPFHTLLLHGADPTVQDEFGKLPLDYLSDRESFDSTTVFLLLQSMVAAGG